MEVRVSRASSVIVHRVPPEGVERFLDWQRAVAAETARFPGYQATDIYPPDEGQQEWVIILHFDGQASLQRWMDSPLRAEWLAKLQGIVSDYRVQALPGGFGTWFAGRLGPPDRPLPPPWKMALSVLLGLYPTVMLLSVIVGPYTKPLGQAGSMLLGNALSVSVLQWAVMPVVLKILGPWLRTGGRSDTIVGLVLVLLALLGLLLMFRVVTG